MGVEDLTSDDIELVRINLGATISLEDVNNIYFVSSFIEGSNSIFTYTENSLTSTSTTTISICCEDDLLYNFVYPMDGVNLSSYNSYFTTPAFSKSKFKSTNYRFQLTNDIEITDTMSPIGADNIIDGGVLPFTEIFDGQFFTISYTASELDESSFIHTLGDGATITNLIIKCNLDTGNNSGGLASYVESGASVTISNSIVMGEISCPNLSTSKQVGGFIANVQSGCEVKFTNCGSYVDMISTSSHSESFGGFIGIANSPKTLEFDTCSYFGNISGISEYLGGYIGYVNDYTSLIKFYGNCATAGTISGGSYIGGYVGYFYAVNGSSTATFDFSTIGGLLDFSYDYKSKEVISDSIDRLLSLHCTSANGYVGGIYGLINSNVGSDIRDVEISDLYLYVSSSSNYGITCGKQLGAGPIFGQPTGSYSLYTIY